MIERPDYGAAEAILEGFPDLKGNGFVAMFTKANKCDSLAVVRRIQFEYVLGFCPKCSGEGHTIDRGSTCAHCLLVLPA